MAYTNITSITDLTNLPIYGEFIQEQDLNLIPNSYFNTNIGSFTPNLELHVYDTINNLLTSQQNVLYYQFENTSSIDQNVKVNLDTEFRKLGLTRGEYTFALNVHQNIIGNFESPSFYISEISPSRSEIRLFPVNNSTTFVSQYNNLQSLWTNTLEFVITDTNRLYPRFSDYGSPFFTASINRIRNVQPFETSPSNPVVYFLPDDGEPGYYQNTAINNYPGYADLRRALDININIILEIDEDGATVFNDTTIRDNFYDQSLNFIKNGVPSGNFGYREYLQFRNLILKGTLAWAIAADIAITPETVTEFSKEIKAFIGGIATIDPTLALFDLIINNSLSKEFWKRDTNGTPKYYGNVYFDLLTLAKAGYTLLPDAYPTDLMLNFGNNELYQISNLLFNNSDGSLLVKVTTPLSIEIIDKDVLWVCRKLIQPYIDKIILLTIVEQLLGNTLKGPNFDIEAEEAQSIATSFKSWNDLLAANIQTNQQIVDKFFGAGLSGIKLNINYGTFDTFIHFSSAEERVRNFHYKLQLIEFYTDRISTLLNVTGSINVNLRDTLQKRNAVISGFDDFEKYLFFEPTGSQLYTHETIDIQPWPKTTVVAPFEGYQWQTLAQQWEDISFSWENGGLITSDPYVYFSKLYRTTSDSGSAYYSNLLELAQIYDRENVHTLVKTIPQHIGFDTDNEGYLLFVNMIGHYYDILWTYVHYLNTVNVREEHPKAGVSQDLIYDIAKSLGVNVFNGKKSKDLWNYTLGLDSTGSYVSTGSLHSLPAVDMTKETWRRIVNNLPYLFKTKGTARSIKALLSCYGIPQSVLTIKEYGGPDNITEEPQWIHPVFAYAYKAQGTVNNFITTPWDNFTKVNSDNSTVNKYPDAIQFRFRTDDNFTYDQGVEYSLLRSETGNVFDDFTWTSIQTQWGTTPITFGSGMGMGQLALSDDPLFEITLKRTSSDKGSLKFYLSGSAGLVSSSIDDLYLFDNNFNNVVLQRNKTTDTITEPSQSFTLKFQKGLYGKIVASGSTTINITGSNSASYNAAWLSGSQMLWGATGVNTLYNGTVSKFNGLYQELRYWYDILKDESITNHTLSPYSYNGNTWSSSYYDLAFRTSLTRKNLLVDSSSSFMQVYSQHPNQTINNTLSAIFADYTTQASVPFEAVEETYHTQYAGLSGHTIFSEKIRIESQSLVDQLNVAKRVTKSSHDLYALDSNKLGIYFSPQNGINEDIVNHLGYVSIDDYIGDPRDTYNPIYTPLSIIQQEYWKKYQNPNDFEAYFRALTIYDFSFFKQIKQFLPARVNLVSGLVIEPNLLERSKARAYRKPEVQNNSYDINYNVSNNIGITGSFADSINITYDWGFVQQITGSLLTNLSQSIDLSYIGTILTGSIGSVNVTTGLVSLSNVITANIDNLEYHTLIYNGTQISSTNYNVPSADTIDNGPVIELITANPLQIYTNGVGGLGPQ